MTKKLIIAAMAGLMAMATNAQEKTMKAYMVADAHLDTQWNWDVQTTISQYVWNTLNQNLFLLKNYPDYVFNFEGGVKYSWMKEYYPLQYEEMKKYIAEGRWHITGSSWDANETIICSPESWIRNVLLGQTFYRQEFGTEGTDIFLPDCFGFGYDLPTLAKHCGLIGFSSQKLIWRTNPFYEGNKRYPFSVGLWQGIDGERIMMAHGFNYAQRYEDGTDLTNHEPLIKAIKESPLGIAYHYYGTGDVGGSPNIPSVKAVVNGIKGKGPVQIVSATSDQLYKDFLPFDQHPELPVFDGELTMDVHGNGCYTSQAAMKLYNRQNEHLGDAAERSAVMADWLGTAKYPIQKMTENWRRLIWHHFHDDVTGTSIPRAYEFSWNDELLGLKTFSDVVRHSVSGIVSLMDTRASGQPVVVYNNEAFPVKGLTEVNLSDNANYQVTDAEGKRVLSQVVERNGQRILLFDAEVPSTGLSVYSVKAGGKATLSSPNTVRADLQSDRSPNTIENSDYRLTVDEYGDVVSLFDKIANKELVAQGKCIQLAVFNECSSPAWPAWEILKATIDREPVSVHDAVKVSVEKGPLRQTLVVSKRYGDSDILQRIHLYNGSMSRRIDFENEVDWRSENALLKAVFPLSVSNEEATYDIGLGSVRRGNNRDNAFEVYAHEWTDLTDRTGQYGVTILNDSRYGWDKPADNTLRLSLLYSPKPGRHYTYQARQDMGHHVFTYSIIGHQGALNQVEAVRQSTQLNSPLRAFRSDKHSGVLGKSFSFVQSDNDNVLVRTIKQAEVSNEYVVRVYEIGGKAAQTAHLTFPAEVVKAAEADGTERTIGQAVFAGNQLTIDIKPNSVRTFKLKLAAPHPRTLTPSHHRTTAHLDLPYNRRCFSFNEFRGAADFEGGYSYAAELLPKEGITVDDIPFCFGPMDGMNGLSCNGDTLDLSKAILNTQHPSPTTHLYLLMASDQDDRMATFTVGKSVQTALVPYYTGFVGQWEHDGHTKGFLKQAQVAYVGSHRHSTSGDEPYEYTYMFKVRVDIPKGAKSVILPNDPHLVVFAATLADDADDVQPAAPLFKTSLRESSLLASQSPLLVSEDKPDNLLQKAQLLSVSGEVNEWERAANLIDGNTETKWCDSQQAPHYVVYDFQQPTIISHWHLLNAAAEDRSYITRTCLLQGRNSLDEEWQTLDIIDGNRSNIVDRDFQPVSVRYLRLYVVSPTQGRGGASRIYELSIY